MIDAFTYDLGYTFYQIFLLMSSISTVWIIVESQQIPIFHESITYIFILFGYYASKYLIRGVNRLINRIFKKIDFSTYHPIKRKRVRRLWRRMGTEEREAQW